MREKCLKLNIEAFLLSRLPDYRREIVIKIIIAEQTHVCILVGHSLSIAQKTREFENCTCILRTVEY